MIEISEHPYAGWERALWLTNGTVELVVTLEVGPRIIRFAQCGGENIFQEFTDQLGKKGEEEWMIRGGHRFWTAPETQETYTYDNDSVAYRIVSLNSVEIEQAPNHKTGWKRTLIVTLHDDGLVKVEHRLENIGTSSIDIYPWALTVLRGGGVAVIPQSTYRWHPGERPDTIKPNDTDFLPNRKVILWKYTDLSDPRFTFGTDFWWIEQKSNTLSLKFGLEYDQGWVAYQWKKIVFCKHVAYEQGALYPDMGSNFELYTGRDILELETLAPARPLAPGSSTTLTENWKLLQTEGSVKDWVNAKEIFASLPSLPSL